jgi:hypothetical protein
MIALLAAPASALAADVVVPSRVAGSTTVPAGGSSTLTLRCPATAVALNAAVTGRGDGVTVRRSTPGAGAGTWSFRVAAAAGARRRGVHAVLRCVRLSLPVGVSGARLDVNTRRPPVVVPARTGASVRLRCGRAWVGTGYGFDPGTSGNVRLASVMPTAHGWDFRLENTGSSAGSARVSARCLRQTVPASSGGQLRFGVARRVFSDDLRPLPGAGRTTFTHNCGENQFGVATGFSLDPSNGVEVTATHPIGKRAGRWTFRGADDADVAKTFLLCLSRRTQFG